MADSIRSGLAEESEMISNRKRNLMTRREMLKRAAGASAAMLAAPTINGGIIACSPVRQSPTLPGQSS